MYTFWLLTVRHGKIHPFFNIGKPGKPSNPYHTRLAANRAPPHGQLLGRGMTHRDLPPHTGGVLRWVYPCVCRENEQLNMQTR